MGALLDETDQRILEYLKRDSHASVSRIARELDLPRSTIAERIKRMEKQQVILSYTVKINHMKVGNPATAFIFVRIRPDPDVRDQYTVIGRQLGRLAAVEEVHMITGEWDVLLKVRGSGLNEFFGRLMEDIRRIPGIERTVTMSCFTTLKEPV